MNIFTFNHTLDSLLCFVGLKLIHLCSLLEYFHYFRDTLMRVMLNYLFHSFQGTLDIAMTVKRVNESTGSHVFKLIFVKNNLADDTCFLKVTGNLLRTSTAVARFCLIFG